MLQLPLSQCSLIQHDIHIVVVSGQVRSDRSGEGKPPFSFVFNAAVPTPTVDFPTARLAGQLSQLPEAFLLEALDFRVLANSRNDCQSMWFC